MISIGGGRESMELQMSFGKIAELCIPDPLRFKVRFLSYHLMKIEQVCRTRKDATRRIEMHVNPVAI